MRRLADPQQSIFDRVSDLIIELQNSFDLRPA
jgi:hypothetical protein